MCPRRTSAPRLPLSAHFRAPEAPKHTPKLTRPARTPPLQRESPRLQSVRRKPSHSTSTLRTSLACLPSEERGVGIASTWGGGGEGSNQTARARLQVRAEHEPSTLKLRPRVLVRSPTAGTLLAPRGGGNSAVPPGAWIVWPVASPSANRTSSPCRLRSPRPAW